eukprot:snap_masked-scaffold_37-processed-gene-1.30-mRNA-1 protein AED:1.00 eAED:1.00 QI:0/-1/0/0/-1/1/1/0/342
MITIRQQKYVNKIEWKLNKDTIYLNLTNKKVRNNKQHQGFEEILLKEKDIYTIVIYGNTTEVKTNCLLSIAERLEQFRFIKYIRYSKYLTVCFLFATLQAILLRNQVKGCFFESFPLNLKDLEKVKNIVVLLEKNKYMKNIYINTFSEGKDIQNSIKGQKLYSKLFNSYGQEYICNKLVPLTSNVSFLFNLENVTKLELHYFAKLSVQDLNSLCKSEILFNLKELEIVLDTIYSSSSYVEEYLISKLFYKINKLKKFNCSFSIEDKSRVNLLSLLLTQLINSEIIKQTKENMVHVKIFSRKEKSLHFNYTEKKLNNFILIVKEGTKKSGKIQLDSYGYKLRV